jgi:hypothetical protein
MSMASPTPAASGSSPRASAALLATLGAGTILLHALTTSFTVATGSGAVQLGLAERPEWVFRPAHLLGTAFIRVLVAAAAAIGFPGEALPVVHALGVLLAGASVVLLVVLCGRLGAGAWQAALAGIVLGASHALLQHAGSGSPTAMALPFGLGALVLAAGRRQGWLRWALPAALWALSVLLAAGMILLLPVVLALLAAGAPAGRRARSTLGTAAFCAALALGPFVVVSRFDAGAAAAPGFLDWLLARSDAQALAAATGGALQLPRAVVGIGRLVFAPSESESAVRAALTGQPSGALAGGALALVRNLLAAGLLLALAGRGALERRAAGAGTLALGLGAPVVLASLLGSWWLSSDPELWLPVFPLLLALAAFGLPAAEALTRPAAALAVGASLAAAMAGANRCQDAPSALCREGGAEWRAAARAARAAGEGALVLAPTGSELLLLPHLSPAVRALPLDQSIPQDIDAGEYLGEIWSAVEESFSRGRRVYVQGLADPLPARLTGAWAAIESKHGVSRAMLRRLIDHEFRRRPAPEVGVAVEELLPRLEPPRPLG